MNLFSPPKSLFSLFFFLFSLVLFAQSDTEVYLFDLATNNGAYTLSNSRNVSNNPGYDNQPSFYNNEILLFAGTRNGQTDIAAYQVVDNNLSWISNTGQGSEYSPTRIPSQEAVSSIRLDTTGLQRLYRYDYRTGNDKVLIKDLVIGYHTWFNKYTIASAVLADGGLDLVVSNLKDQTNNTHQKKIGRSLHKIPNSERISYISKENEAWEIKSLDPLNGATERITYTLNKAEDMCWLPDGTILMPQDNMIYKFNPKTDQSWSIIHVFNSPDIWNISRITVSPDGRHLALVSEVSPEGIVQRQLDAYNARDIDAFMNTYSDDIKLYNFPDQLSTEGKDAMREGYTSFFSNTPDLHCEIKNRIVIGNKVIDEEYLTVNGNHVGAVAIYEVESGKIAKVTFISN